jgi:hypothetical protein
VKLNRILFLKRVYETLPVRTCSIHFGIPDSPFNQLMQTLITLSMPQYMQRMKFHVGTFSFQFVVVIILYVYECVMRDSWKLT